MSATISRLAQADSREQSTCLCRKEKKGERGNEGTRERGSSRKERRCPFSERERDREREDYKSKNINKQLSKRDKGEQPEREALPSFRERKRK